MLRHGPNRLSAVRVPVRRRAFRRGARSFAAVFALPVLIAASLVAAACGGSAAEGPAEDDRAAGDRATGHPTTEEPTTASTPGSGVVFIEQEPVKGLNLGPTAMGGGKLVIDEEGCLRLKLPRGDGPSDIPVWPHGYSLSTENDEIRILNDKGRVVARVGDTVQVGGGEISRSEAGGNFEEKRRKLGVPARCPGPLWMVFNEVRVLKRG